MDAPSQAIELLGGSTVVSAEMGRRPTTVASWASRESIPVEEWPALLEIAARKAVEGFTCEALMQAHVQAARKRKAA